jgi:hypothetical protein
VEHVHEPLRERLPDRDGSPLTLDGLRRYTGGLGPTTHPVGLGRRGGAPSASTTAIGAAAAGRDRRYG